MIPEDPTRDDLANIADELNAKLTDRMARAAMPLVHPLQYKFLLRMCLNELERIAPGDKKLFYDIIGHWAILFEKRFGRLPDHNEHFDPHDRRQTHIDWETVDVEELKALLHMDLQLPSI